MGGGIRLLGDGCAFEAVRLVGVLWLGRRDELCIIMG